MAFEGNKMTVSYYLFFCLLATGCQILVLTFYSIYIELSINFACRLIVILCILEITTWSLQSFLCIFNLATNLTIYEVSETFCGILAYFSNFLMLLAIITVLLITLSLYIQVIYRKNPLQYEKFFYVFSISYTTFFTILPLFIAKDVNNVSMNLQCWIKNTELRILSLYSHLWLAILLSFFFLIRVLRTLKQEIFKDIEMALMKKLSWIPLISLIFWLGPSLFRVFASDEVYNADSIHFFLMPIQGFANAIVYGNINDEVKKKIKALFCLNVNELMMNKSFVQRNTESLKPKLQTQNSGLERSNSNTSEIEDRTKTKTCEMEDQAKTFEIERHTASYFLK